MPDGKTLTFELRSNTAGNSTGATNTTVIHDRIACKDITSVDRDYYKNGRIVTQTVISTGVEHFWLRMTSKSSVVADGYWWIYYTTL